MEGFRRPAMGQRGALYTTAQTGVKGPMGQFWSVASGSRSLQSIHGPGRNVAVTRLIRPQCASVAPRLSRGDTAMDGQ